MGNPCRGTAVPAFLCTGCHGGTVLYGDVYRRREEPEKQPGICGIRFFGRGEKNWRQALAAGTVLAAVLLFQILLIVYGIWVFAQIAVYENTLRQILKNGVILMLRHLLVSFAIFLLLVFAAVVIWILPFSILFMPVVSTWLMTALLEKVFEKYGS